MSTDLSPEEQALLEDDAKPKRRPKKAEDTEAPPAEKAGKVQAPEPTAAEPAKAEKRAERGPHSPAQWDDDGWSQTPIQMRG